MPYTSYIINKATGDITVDLLEDGEKELIQDMAGWQAQDAKSRI